MELVLAILAGMRNVVAREPGGIQLRTSRAKVVLLMGTINPMCRAWVMGVWLVKRKGQVAMAAMSRALICGRVMA